MSPVSTAWRNEVLINPELYYELWKQEHGERLRTAGRREAIREARLTRGAGRHREVEGSTATHWSWLTLLSDGVLRIRKLWTIS
jgi:hypothetical protein